MSPFILHFVPNFFRSLCFNLIYVVIILNLQYSLNKTLKQKTTLIHWAIFGYTNVLWYSCLLHIDLQSSSPCKIKLGTQKNAFYKVECRSAPKSSNRPLSNTTRGVVPHIYSRLTKSIPIFRDSFHVVQAKESQGNQTPPFLYQISSLQYLLRPATSSKWGHIRYNLYFQGKKKGIPVCRLSPE